MNLNLVTQSKGGGATHKAAAKVHRSATETDFSVMNDVVTVAQVQDIPPGTGRTVEVREVWIALFNVEGTFYAIDNACPHAGGPLGEGKLCGSVVECPWHGWKFNVVTGQRENNPNFEVPCCQVRVEGDQIQISLPPGLVAP